MASTLTSAEEHYEWSRDMLFSLAMENIIKKTIGFGGLSMAFVVTLEMMFGYGATTPFQSAIQWISMIGAYCLCGFWLFGPWPTLNQAFAFVVCSNIAIFSATMVADFPPEITLGKSAFFIPTGMFVGFFFERGMMFYHIIFCACATTFIAFYVVVFAGVSPLMGFVVWAPVTISASGFVLLLHFAIRSMRFEFE